ncbi:MAG TPA: enoyl-CoA hydratase/isomerase family protein [Solirubrobacterales bacterium]|nr:enoyl-CoA hydratase/isomerase family protein [Solirubrobacterales bacterium]
MSVVLAEDADGVRTLTLNRPDRLNAIDGETRRALNEELRRADEDPAVRCIVLTGAGRAFCAGADLKEDDERVPHGQGAAAWHRFLERTNQGDAAIDTRSLAKPVVAAVNGLAYGIGMLTAVECDLLVAAASARFGMLEARMGSGGSTVLPFLIGPQWTRYLMYSGETIDAATARRIGLVIEVVPDAELAARVHDLAARIAAMPPLQVHFSKRQTEGTLAMMGKLNNEVFSLANQAILNSLAGEATAPDGRKLLDVLAEEGLAGLTRARDAGHEEPWLR